MAVRAVRGATSVAKDDAVLVHESVRELIIEIAEQNAVRPEHIVSAIFTATDDLRSTFPATGARELPGWRDVPMLCARELEIEGGLARCIRVLLHVETTRAREEIRHVYLRDARALRPDLAGTGVK
jgi:chorismate mutase